MTVGHVVLTAPTDGNLHVRDPGRMAQVKNSITGVRTTSMKVMTDTRNCELALPTVNATLLALGEEVQN